VYYVRDGGGQILAEYDGDGRLLAEYVYAMGGRVAKISASGMRFYYHTDLVGTPLAITDQGGNLSWRGEYLPFGSEHTSTDAGDHFKFTGKELEDHTGLYYFEARYYEPATGRFISIDPVGGDVASSQSWNRYAYAENNPVRRIDLTGETFWDVLDIGFFAASIGNLWVKAIEGTPITASDNLQVAGDAVGMIPIVPAIGTGGRLAKEGIEHGADVVRAADELAEGHRTVIGKMKGIDNIGPGEHILAQHLPDRGSPKANWKQNAGALRREMKKGRPVRDASVGPGGELVRYPGSFLEAERNLLSDRGWTYDQSTQLWMPPE
jgi:RHS repeat-associated protein